MGDDSKGLAVAVATANATQKDRLPRRPLWSGAPGNSRRPLWLAPYDPNNLEKAWQPYYIMILRRVILALSLRMIAIRQAH